MKRAAALRGLSDDHHRALVLAKRAKAAASEHGDDAVKALWAEIHRAWESALAPHFAIEETCLLPPLRAAGGEALASRLEQDHAALRELLLSGRHDAMRLRQFAERLADHVRFEEREVFPFAQAKLTQDALDRVAAAHGGQQPAG